MLERQSILSGKTEIAAQQNAFSDHLEGGYLKCSCSGGIEYQLLSRLLLG